MTTSRHQRPRQETLFEASGAANAAPDTSEVLYVRVAVERGIDSAELIEGLTYRCEPPGVRVGDRVRVPLGRGNTPARGTVIETGGPELLGGYPASRVKPILSHDGAGLTAELIELAKWIAAYYVCPLGMVLSGMLPAAVKKAAGRRRETVLTLGEIGAATAAQEWPRAARALLARVREVPPDQFPMSAKALAAAVGLKTPAPLKRLITLGGLIASQREVIRDQGWSEPAETGPAGVPTLTAEQTQAVEGIARTLGSFAVHLVHGVTGSGKTEVYLRLIERVMARGQAAVVLVPEIALTPQTSRRFRERFADYGVSVLHSGLSASQRHAEWERARSGASRVVVGARSAVFAPLENVGLFIVDEEHDSSYKQDQAPRYHGRDVAVKRAQIAGCPAVLGSATPALESWWNATRSHAAPSDRRAAWSLWSLPNRVAGVMPAVQIADLRLERRARLQDDPGSKNKQLSIGPTLERGIGRTLDAGGQVILLLNRRGFAHYIACPSPACGWVLGCDACDATMVFHKDRQLPRGGDVACHHCLARQLLPQACPQCGRALTLFGSGTQRVEDELVRLFGGSHGLDAKSLLRADSDSMGSARDYFDALGRFARGEVRVLLGTQMIAKGLDFPNVRLVGVINADTALHLPDFRADERTFQLITQVAGRAGRGAAAGHVIVQTMAPTSRAITHAAQHDYVGFAKSELESRRAHALPPATRMARVVCRHRDAAAAMKDAGKVGEALRTAAESLGIRARLGSPARCAIERLHSFYRAEILLIADRAGDVQKLLTAARSAGALTSDARTAVDVDPVSLL